MKFLFEPATVRQILAGHAHLGSNLNPESEGQPSAAFSTARKSPREIYRVLSNVHYPYLNDLVSVLDECLAQGFYQPTILRTRGRKPFAEALAELRAAKHFVLRNFVVRGLDAGKDQDSVPDLIAVGGGLEVAVEVYCPRAWEELAQVHDDLNDFLQNLDLPYDYEFAVAMKQLDYGNEQSCVSLHPGDLSELITPPIREHLLRNLLSELIERIHGPQSTFVAVRELKDINLRLMVDLSRIAASRGRLPARKGSISGPSLSGYAPEGMFDRLVNRNVRAKARKRQAVGHGTHSLLLVDLSHYELTSELSHSYYRERFNESLVRHLGHNLEGYDMIAFCEALGWKRELGLHFLMREDRIDTEVTQHLFGTSIS